MLIIVFSVIAFLWYIKIFDRYTLSAMPSNKRYKYTLIIIQNNNNKCTHYLYSDYGKYTVEDLMNSLWDKTLKAYIVQETDSRKVVYYLNQLSYCECFVESRGDKK